MVIADPKAFATVPRDLRIDFFRGLALYMILVDHVIGDPLSMLTYRILGFSDAAEIFVFLSGLACGTAYSRTFARGGLSGLAWVATMRAGRIYLYYVLSSAATALAVMVAMTQNSSLTNYFEIEHPSNAIWSALWLLSLPPYSEIFVLYIIFTLVVVPAFLIAGERYRFVALATSGVIWLVAQNFSDFLAPLTHHLVFNPFAWQFLFVIGIFLATERDVGQSILRSRSHLRWAVLAACTIVISSFLYKLLQARSGFDITWLRLEPSSLASMKGNLSPIRLVHFLSVALLVAVYVRRDSPFLKWRISMPLIKTGMHSLQVFSLVVVLGNIVNLIVLTGDPPLRDRLIMDSIAFLAMALTGIALTPARETLVRVRKTLVRADPKSS
jgi:hypothetical protein